MSFIKAIWLFYVFKFAPRIIDHKANKFWVNSVALLNKQRAKTKDAFYLSRFLRIYIRDPHSFPNKMYWTSASWHPFCYMHTNYHN